MNHNTQPLSCLNVEIKARASNLNSARSVLQSVKADFCGTDHQIDTYFRVSRGRLKLREGNIENFLIFYDREDCSGPKKSQVTLYKTSQQSALKEILIQALETLVVVDKTREIYFKENVKFHLDTVKQLGTFIEIEAIDSNATIGQEKLQKQCEQYIKPLNISKENLISVSYSDLLLQKGK